MEELIQYLKSHSWSTNDDIEFRHSIKGNRYFLVNLDRNNLLAEIKHFHNSREEINDFELGYVKPHIILDLLKTYPDYI
jgi:hypothetical protein